MNKLKSFFRSKRVRWILSFFALLIFLLLIRSCMSSEYYHHRIYHIARGVNWNPIELSGKEANLPAFIDELLTAIAEDQSLAVDMDTFQSGDLFRKLDSEEYDAILVTLTMDPFLKTHYEISDSIFQAGPVLVVLSTSQITSPLDLEGRAIGVSKESPMIFHLANQHPDLQLVSYDSNIEALNALEGHSVGGVIMEAQLAYTYTHALFSGKLKVATPPLIDIGIRLLTRKEKSGEHFIENFNEGLKKLKANGMYDQLLQKWELVSPT